jgi:hypothetical protein
MTDVPTLEVQQACGCPNAGETWGLRSLDFVKRTATYEVRCSRCPALRALIVIHVPEKKVTP